MGCVEASRADYNGFATIPQFSQRGFTMESNRSSKFAHYLIDSKREAQKASTILAGLSEPQSPRRSRIAQKMPPSPHVNYDVLQTSRESFMRLVYDPVRTYF
jgi:hypothetical protein